MGAAIALILWALCLIAPLAGGAGSPAVQEATQRVPKELTAAEAAKAYAAEWNMEAAAYVAALVVRDQHCKSDPAACDLSDASDTIVDDLGKWAAVDPGWDRLLSSVSLYEIARHAYQQAQHDEAIIALEESLALRLFAYVDQPTLDKWQQGLVLPGSLFRRQKMDLANILVLRSDCLVQLAQEQRDVDDLTEATELLNLATALLKAANELVPDSVNALRRRAQTIARVAIDLLPRLKPARVAEALSHYGVPCSSGGRSKGRGGGDSCGSTMEGLAKLVPLLRLPVIVTGTGASARLEVPEDPFASHVTALLRRPSEHVAQYMQRIFFRLLAMVPMDYLAELDVPCRKTGAGGRCVSYLPQWVTARTVAVDKRTGLLQVSSPGRCDTSGGSGKGAEDCSCCDGGGASGSLRSNGKGDSCSCGTQQLDSSGDGDELGDDLDEDGAAGSQLCGFLYMRALPSGVDLPSTGGSLTAEQQRLLQRKDAAASDARGNPAAAGSKSAQPFQGVYYYYYNDIPALIDRIVNTFDDDEADFLLGQLDTLTGARRLRSLGLPAARPQPNGCTETRLLEGRAPAGCSVLLPNFGPCATAPLKPPRRRVPLPPPPAGLSLPPPRGTYKPQYRRLAPEVRWARLGLDDLADLAELAEGIRGGGAAAARAAAAAAAARAQGGWGRSGRGLASAEREFADRQLQEQLAKLSRDPTGRGSHHREDPLVPLTLAVCVAATVGLYLVSRRRRRGGGAGGGGGAASGAAALIGSRVRGSGSGSGTAGDGHGTAAAPSESQLKQRAAAALRDAMAGNDVAKLDAAVEDAAALGLDPVLLQRARVLLSQRRKRERERAQAARERARAAKREAARRQKQHAAAAAGGRGSDVGAQQQHEQQSSGDVSGHGGGILSRALSSLGALLGSRKSVCAPEKDHGSISPSPQLSRSASAAAVGGGGSGVSSPRSSSRVSTPVGGDTLTQSDTGDGSIHGGSGGSPRRLRSAFSGDGGHTNSGSGLFGGSGGLVHAGSVSTFDSSEDAGWDGNGGWQEAAGPYKRKAAKAAQAQFLSLSSAANNLVASSAASLRQTAAPVRPPVTAPRVPPTSKATGRQKMHTTATVPMRPNVAPLAAATPPRTPPSAAPPPALDGQHALRRASPAPAVRAAPPAPAPPLVTPAAEAPAASAGSGSSSWLGWLGVTSTSRSPQTQSSTNPAPAPPLQTAARPPTLAALLQQPRRHDAAAAGQLQPAGHVSGGGSGLEPLVRVGQQHGVPSTASSTPASAKRQFRTLNPEAAPYQPVTSNATAPAATHTNGFASPVAGHGHLPFAQLLQNDGAPLDLDAGPFSSRDGGTGNGTFGLPLFTRDRASSDFGTGAPFLGGAGTGSGMGMGLPPPPPGAGGMLLPPLPPDAFPGGAVHPAAAAGGLLPALLPELGGSGAAAGVLASPHHRHHPLQPHLGPPHFHPSAHHPAAAAAAQAAALHTLPDTLFPGFRSYPSDEAPGGTNGSVGIPSLRLPDEPFGPHQPPASGGMDGRDWQHGGVAAAAPPPPPPPPPSVFSPHGGLWGGGGGLALGDAHRHALPPPLIACSSPGVTSVTDDLTAESAHDDEAELNKLAQEMMKGLVE